MKTTLTVTCWICGFEQTFEAEGNRIGPEVPAAAGWLTLSERQFGSSIDHDSFSSVDACEAHSLDELKINA